MPNTHDTRTKIITAAEGLTQTRGYNGFSYIDLAEKVGIKTASIHYYFKTKDDLAAALVHNSEKTVSDFLQSLELQHASPTDRLRGLLAYFKSMVEDDSRFCLCGMLAVEMESLSMPVKMSVRQYFRTIRAWLERQFYLLDQKTATVKAAGFISALEGGLLLARLEGNATLLDHSTQAYLT